MIKIINQNFNKIMDFHQTIYGSSINIETKIKPEIINWLKRNNIKYRRERIFSENESPYRAIYFENPDDEILFKLTWL